MTESKVMTMGLTAQELLFCEEYVVDFLGTDAAMRAGFPAKTAPRSALALLKRKDIRDQIREMSAKTMSKHGLAADMVIGELALIAFSNMDDYLVRDGDGDPHFDFAKVTRRQMAAVAELTIEEYMDGKGVEARPVRKTRVRLHSKQDALVNLGKHFNIFKSDDAPKAIALILSADEETA